MKTITLFFILNATLLLLHEIESAYEKEWEILKLPGEITGFITMHIPIILLLMYGVIEINSFSQTGRAIGIITGIGGIAPSWSIRFSLKGKIASIGPYPA